MILQTGRYRCELIGSYPLLAISYTCLLIITKVNVDLSLCCYGNFLMFQLDVLRKALRSYERRRGRPYSDSEPIRRQTSEMLLQSLEKCLEEAKTETELYEQRTLQVK